MMIHPKREALLIVGMHRSGTSALARALNLLGANAGFGLLPAVRGDNDRGYWELREVVALNNECLEHFGLSWRHPNPMPEAWLDDPWLDDWRQRATSLIEHEFSDEALFLIKDPRLSRLLPVWREVLERIGIRPVVIVVVRHPLEVAASLLRRPDVRMTAFHAHYLWLRYLADAETGSRGLSRTWIRYDHLLVSGAKALKRVSSELQLEWPNGLDATTHAIYKHLDNSMRHQFSQREVANHHNAAIEASCNIYKAMGTRLDAGRDPGPALTNVELELEALGLSRSESAQPHLSREQQYGSSDASPMSWTPQEFLRLQSRIYFRSADGSYTPEHSAVVEAQLDGDELVAPFILPDGAKLDFVRFDPCELAGVYRIESIVADGRRLRMDGTAVGAVRDRRLSNVKSELVRFVCTDGDPWVEIDLREQSLQATREFAVHFQRESVLELVREPLEQEIHALRADQQRQTAITSNLAGKIQGVREQSRSAHKAACAAYLARVERYVSSRGGGMKLTVSASPHVEMSAQIPGRGVKVWSVTGDDPHFQLHLPRARPSLRSGWYVMNLVLNPLSGRFSRPSLYLDYGEGFSEDNTIMLPLNDNARQHRLLLKFEHPVQALRLDPSNNDKACDFLFSNPSLRRISRGEAMLRLAWPAVHRMRAQDATWLRIIREIWSSLRHGPAKALDALHTNNRVANHTYEISYADWIKANDTLDDSKRAQIRAEVEAMAKPPLISIILPVYNTSERWLRACLESVARQLYPHWELCIADDASTEPHVRVVLEEYAAEDPRIKIIHRKMNGHISAASNSALKLATGAFIALLDHDDELSEHALYHVAKSLQTHPEVRLIYSDEDKIDENGMRFDPYFKPDWNPELFLCQNMVSHLGVYSTDLVRSVGGFREGFEGSQDHDLALRASEQLTTHEILHIPHVLYHWRAIAGSTAMAVSEKAYVREASRRAVVDHLARTGTNAQVTLAPEGYLHIAYALPDPRPAVSIVIPTRDGLHLLRKCVDSVLKHTDYLNFEVIIVDNQSQNPDTLKWLGQIQKRDSRIRVLRIDEPFNFARLNNQAVAHTRGDVLLLLNNDIEVTQGSWLAEMVSHAIRAHTGAVGAKLYYPDGNIQHAGVIIGFGGVAGHAYSRKPHDYIGQMGRAKLTQNMSAVTAACLAVRKSVYLEVGGMNEDLGVAFNDVDFCLRLLKAGYRNIWTPHAELVHHESATRGEENTSEKFARFKAEVEQMHRIWGSQLDYDPAYNPNLCLEKEPFRISCLSPIQASGTQSTAHGSDEYH